jgi:cephalosporin-C deacetylase-like acetyl esterase
LVKVPGYYSWGFNDETCPPTSMYAAYNVITAPKNLFLALESGHWTFPEQYEVTNPWLFGKLLKE